MSGDAPDHPFGCLLEFDSSNASLVARFLFTFARGHGPHDRLYLVVRTGSRVLDRYLAHWIWYRPTALSVLPAVGKLLCTVSLLSLRIGGGGGGGGARHPVFMVPLRTDLPALPRGRYQSLSMTWTSDAASAGGTDEPFLAPTIGFDVVLHFVPLSAARSSPHLNPTLLSYRPPGRRYGLTRVTTLEIFPRLDFLLRHGFLDFLGFPIPLSSYSDLDAKLASAAAESHNGLVRPTFTDGAEGTSLFGFESTTLGMSIRYYLHARPALAHPRLTTTLARLADSYRAPLIHVSILRQVVAAAHQHWHATGSPLDSLDDLLVLCFGFRDSTPLLHLPPFLMLAQLRRFDTGDDTPAAPSLAALSVRLHWWTLFGDQSHSSADLLNALLDLDRLAPAFSPALDRQPVPTGDSFIAE